MGKVIGVLLLLVLLVGCAVQEKLSDNDKAIEGAVEQESAGITQQEIEKVTEDITQQEIERITKEKTKEITEKMIGSTQEKEFQCDPMPHKRQFNKQPYYIGLLIDTHLHMPVASKIVSDTAIQSGFEDMPHVGQIPTGKIACLMKKEGITKAFGFFIVPNIGSVQAVNHVKSVGEQYPDNFVKFFQPPIPLQQLYPTTAEVKEIFNRNPGLFQGMGEIRFDFNLAKNELPEGEYLLDLYGLSHQYNLVVQIHPHKGQTAALERLLKKYPQVKFLAHLMKDEHKELGELLGKYDNLYYSLDAELTFIFGYHTIQNNQGPTKQEFLSSTKKNFDSLLQEAVTTWKPLIEKYPDQFTWGTDRWFTWHFDEEVGALVEEFGRSFIGRLNPAVQEKFAYKNAERLLNER